MIFTGLQLATIAKSKGVKVPNLADIVQKIMDNARKQGSVLGAVEFVNGELVVQDDDEDPIAKAAATADFFAQNPAAYDDYVASKRG